MNTQRSCDQKLQVSWADEVGHTIFQIFCGQGGTNLLHGACTPKAASNLATKYNPPNALLFPTRTCQTLLTSCKNSGEERFSSISVLVSAIKHLSGIKTLKKETKPEVLQKQQQLLCPVCQCHPNSQEEDYYSAIPEYYSHQRIVHGNGIRTD